MSMNDTDELARIGARVKAYRTKQNMTQQELAVRADLSLPHISKIESGKAAMQIPTVLRIAEALQVSLDELLRPNIPQVKGIYRTEFAELLDDCSPSEIESILTVVREFKARLKFQKDEYDQ